MLDQLLDRLARRYPIAPAAAGDLPGAADLFHEVWPALGRDAIEWHFIHRYFLNPAQGGELLLCRDRDRLAACIGTLAFDIVSGNEILPGAAPIDLAVRREYRLAGLAPLLVRHVRSRDAIVLDANLNAGARAVAERLGAMPLVACEVRRRWLSPRDWVRSRERRYGVGTTIAAPARLDRLFETARAEYALATRRDAAVLSWRYEANPRRRFLFHVLDEGDERLAYAVTSFEWLRGIVRRAVLVDFLFAPIAAEERRRFLSCVATTVARRGAACIDAIASRPADVAMLEQAGFRDKGVRTPFLLYANAMAERHAELRRGEEWHMTFGDIDFYL